MLVCVCYGYLAYVGFYDLVVFCFNSVGIVLICVVVVVRLFVSLFCSSGGLMLLAISCIVDFVFCGFLAWVWFVADVIGCLYA